jgi:sterol desaturase/sphingolipid hydroxylase (fatty acid hydroxylase superfamily)
MEKVKRLAWLLCFLIPCGMLLLTGSSQLQQLLRTHGGLPSYLLLTLLLAIPTSVVTLAAAYLFEGLLAGWQGSSLRALLTESASVRLDILSILPTVLPLRYVGYILSLGLLYVSDTHPTRSGTFSLANALPWWGLQLGCFLLLQSCISYWVHRLEHMVPALWALHKFHHSADRMSILTSHRETELARGVEQILPLLFVALVSEPPAVKSAVGSSPLFAIAAAYFLYRTFIRVNQYLCHSNLTTGYGWIGRWLLVSPRMHRLHHAVSPEYHDKNFTFDLVIWDRLFGTYASCDAATASHIPIGLDDRTFNSGSSVKCVLRDYFLTSYLTFWEALRQGWRAWLPARAIQHAPDSA